MRTPCYSESIQSPPSMLLTAACFLTLWARWFSFEAGIIFLKHCERVFRARQSRAYLLVCVYVPEEFQQITFFCYDLVLNFKLYYYMKPEVRVLTCPLSINLRLWPWKFACNWSRLLLHLPMERKVLYFSASVLKTFNFRAFLVFIVRKSRGICNLD